MNSEALIDTLREDDSWWTRVRMTPWRDLLRGRVSGSLDYREAMAEFDLPLPLLRTVDEVVQQTRLWPSERSDVAIELCAHFADGLQSGHTVEELQKSFGSTKESAKLIRRSRVRCRSLSWHVRHRSLQSVAVLALLFAAIWSVVLVRFALAEPTISFDIVAEHDEVNREIPEDERAWSHYRNGLVLIDRREVFFVQDGKPFNAIDYLAEGPGGPRWHQLREHMAKREVPLQLFMAGAQCEQMGFINRDAGNDTWTRWSNFRGWEFYNRPGTPGFHVLLSHTSDLRLILTYLSGAALVAIDDGDSERLMPLLSAMLHVPDHARQSFDGYIADLIAFMQIRTVSQFIAAAVLKHPDLFSQEDLQRLKTGLREALGGQPFQFRWNGERRLVDDFIQRSFTDDGMGNGRFTAEGVKLLQSQVAGAKGKFPVLDVLQMTNENQPDSAQFGLAASAIVELVADRQTVHEKMRELNELRLQAYNDPRTPYGQSEFVEAVEALLGSSDRTRLLPVAVIYGAGYQGDIHYGRQLAFANLTIEAAIIAITLEKHRRQTGEWPSTLADIPRDIYAKDGAPLKYRVVDRQPLLYSVGPNQQDDSGMTAEDDQQPWQSDDGDWVLLPTWEPSD
ncbi:MAG: hypothetical protein KDA93_26470 [Planctomycetaceae bacterium]|nr:hypothetical protein [Planctomycetaceae bacterium]